MSVLLRASSVTPVLTIYDADPAKDITRSLIRSGHWETFIRSLDHELRNMMGKTQRILSTHWLMMSTLPKICRY